MITKQELEKLKELACKCNLGPWVSVTSVYTDGHGTTLCDEHNNYIYNADPDTVLRLIEALEVATEALKRHYMIECIYCVGDGITEEAPNFQNAYGEHGLHTKECLLCRPAKEALNKIYGPT